MSNIARIPDDYTVWAFSDIHGVRSGLSEALKRAGLIDENERWIAPSRTALVGIGDYIDRGTDSLGVLELLERLRKEAIEAGGQVVACRGNHEAMLTSVLDGNDEQLDIWLSDFAGGMATLISIGLDQKSRALARGVHALATAISSRYPHLRAQLRSMPEAAVWRDVLFCHAGPPDNMTPNILAGSQPITYGNRQTLPPSI